jgi:hypothetical protein
MAVELAKINRWAVTGTPLSSSFDDLVSQLYFIELEPFMTVKRPYLCGNQNFNGAFVLNHRVVLHAIDAMPARWRGDAGSSPLDRARTATSSPRNDLVKNSRVRPTHRLISTQLRTGSGRVYWTTP